MAYCASVKVELSLFVRGSKTKQAILKFASFSSDSKRD